MLSSCVAAVFERNGSILKVLIIICKDIFGGCEFFLRVSNVKDGISVAGWEGNICVVCAILAYWQNAQDNADIIGCIQNRAGIC